MPPPPGDDAPSLRELARSLDSLATQLRDIVIELRGLSQVYVPRAEHELQIGGVKVDVRRIDEETQRLDREHGHDIRETRAAQEKADDKLAEALKEQIQMLSSALEKERVDRRAGHRWALGFAVSALGLLVAGTGLLVTVIIPTMARA